MDDQTEVANAQYAAFPNEHGNQVEGGVAWLEVQDEKNLVEEMDGVFQPKAGYAEQPVIRVSWYGAVAYCDWVGGELPTEAMWEVAARGPEGNTYLWGEEAPTCTLADAAGCVGGTLPAGSLPEGASWSGAHDMAGNLCEWVFKLIHPPT